MYKYGNIVYLNESENAELLSGDLTLTRIIHVDIDSLIPTNEYYNVYVIDEDIILL